MSGAEKCVTPPVVTLGTVVADAEADEALLQPRRP